MSKFQMPESVLKQLNEFSGGGYILFVYDQESKPKVYADFDTAAHGLGMQKFIQNWMNIVDTVNLETSINELTNGNCDDDGSSENA